MLHVGAAYHFRGVKEGGTIRFRERPEASIVDRFLDTRGLEADSVNMFGVEGLVILGKLSFQSEYITTMLASPELGDPNFYGYYFYGSYFLTNDRRSYKKGSGIPGGAGRPLPAAR